MEPNLRTLVRVLSLATLMLSSLPSARAQGPLKSRHPQTRLPDNAQVDQRGPHQPQSKAEQQEDALQPPSKADRELERLDREMTRQLFYTKEALLREAMARVREGSSHQFRWIIGDIGAFLIFLVILGSLLWIFRTLLENRRWNKIAKVQSEIHTKLLEKFGSSQELLAYMETEAGKRFLESTPFEIEHKQVAMFPYGRILWSVQVGLILSMMGVGLLLLRGPIPEVAQPLLVFGTLPLTLGVGFMLSAGVSYVLSKSFGLLESTKPTLRQSGPPASGG